MKLINREIDALMDLMQEEVTKQFKKEQEDFKTNPKVIRLAMKLESDYKKIPKELKSMISVGGHYGSLSTIPEIFWTNRAINYLKLKPKSPNSLPGNTRRDIILASADSSTIEEVLVKLKLKK